jgi:hypothetical protein
LSVIVSYFGRPVMFTVTTSLASVVVTLVPRSTVPPLPATQSESSAIVRTGFVTDDGVVGVVSVVGVVESVGVVDVVVSIWSPENVFTAPERFAATPLASLMLAPLGRLTPVIARAEVFVLVDATVVLKVSAPVPEPPT